MLLAVSKYGCMGNNGGCEESVVEMVGSVVVKGGIVGWVGSREVKGGGCETGS